MKKPPRKIPGVTEPLTKANMKEEVERLVKKEFGKKIFEVGGKEIVERSVEVMAEQVTFTGEIPRDNPFRDPDSGAKLPEVLTDYSRTTNPKYNSDKGKGTSRKPKAKIGDKQRLEFMENYLLCRGSVEAAAYQTGISVGMAWEIMKEPEMKKVREEVNLRILDRLFQRMIDEAERNPLMMIFLAKSLDRAKYDDHYARRLLEYKLQKRLQKDLLNVSKDLPGQIILVPEAKPERLGGAITAEWIGQNPRKESIAESKKRTAEETAAARLEALKADTEKDPFK